MANEIVPLLDEESAKAVQEAAKLGSNVNDTVQKTGSYLARIVGNLPVDLIGIMGDWVLNKRVQRWRELEGDTIEILKRRGVKPPYVDVSPSLAKPLIDAALDDTRDELKTLWARLLANALDERTKGVVRNSFIDILKQLEPLDALILQTIEATPGNYMPDAGSFLASTLKRPQDHIMLGLENLANLRLVDLSSTRLSTLGRVFFRAVSG